MSFNSNNSDSGLNSSPKDTTRLIDTTDDDIDSHDIDDLIIKAGGFGKMQWIIMLAAIILYQGIGSVVYNLAYLELVPYIKCKYYGEDHFVKCKNERDICHKGKVEEWYVDYEEEESFHNWMTDQNLYCEDSFLIGLFGSVYFLGFALSGFILKQSDTYGRKKIMTLGSFLQIIALYGIYFSDNYIAYYVFLFIGGLAVSRNVCTYIYATECVPARYQITVGAMCLSFDVLIPVTISSVYYFFGGIHWRVPLFPALIFPFIGLIFLWFLPESPRYLYARKKFTELREVILTYAKVNGSTMTHDYLIDEEVKQNQSSSKFYSKLGQDLQFINIDASQLKALTLHSKSKGNESIKEEEYSVMKALKNRQTLQNLIALLICFSVVSFNYYMVGFYLKYVGGDIFINSLSASYSESVGNFTAGFVQRYVGTKRSFLF